MKNNIFLTIRRCEWRRVNSFSTVRHTTQAQFTPKFEYQIRQATICDVQQISNCNRRNLPENYDNAYIANQILSWPLLSYVVEVEENIAGYVLGRIDVSSGSNGFHHLFRDTSGYYTSPKDAVSGHIISIAVEESFRRHGMAAELMTTIHKEMCTIPHLQSINLLCRVSNVGAIQHYTKVHGYECKRRLETYYADGEDGWFMEWRRTQLDAIERCLETPD